MRRALLPVLVLIAVSVPTTLPVVATSGNDNWKILVFAWNSGTVVSPNASYCLMPATMPIRPGNFARLLDARGRELGVRAFQDIVEEGIGTGDYQPGDSCELVAIFPPVTPQEGLRIVITPDPTPRIAASAERVTMRPYAESFAYDWWYTEEGYKACRFLGDVELGQGALFVSHPPARLVDGTDRRTHQWQSGVSFSVRDAAERCGLTALLEFPVVGEYVIMLGATHRTRSRSSYVIGSVPMR